MNSLHFLIMRLLIGLFAVGASTLIPITSLADSHPSKPSRAPTPYSFGSFAGKTFVDLRPTRVLPAFHLPKGGYAGDGPYSTESSTTIEPPGLQRYYTPPQPPPFESSSNTPQEPNPAIKIYTMIDRRYSGTSGKQRTARSPSQHSTEQMSPNTFFGYGSYDVSGASDGTYGLTAADGGYITAFTVTGSKLFSQSLTAFFCTVKLAVCGTGFPGDARIAYDTDYKRWIVSALWFASSGHSKTSVIAVSKNSSPTSGYWYYEYPTCDPSYDGSGGADQPHLGFSLQWIAVNALCPLVTGHSSNAGLTVFDKLTLYNGQGIAQGSSEFKFNDAVDHLSYNRDNPVNTYAPTYGNRAYFSESYEDKNGHAAVSYSYLQGATSNPVFYGQAFAVVTTLNAVREGRALLSAPGCNDCVPYQSNSYTHSSEVFATRPNNYPAVISSAVYGDPRFKDASELVDVALNLTTGNAVALALYGGQSGAGPMASEIVAPAVNPRTYNTAIVAYDWTSISYYPGLEYDEWNLDANNYPFGVSLQEGYNKPIIGPIPDRFMDYLDAACPVANSTQVFIGGVYSYASSGTGVRDTQRRSVFGFVNS